MGLGKGVRFEPSDQAPAMAKAAPVKRKIAPATNRVGWKGETRNAMLRTRMAVMSAPWTTTQAPPRSIKELFIVKSRI
jgi:hypothetical protein